MGQESLASDFRLLQAYVSPANPVPVGAGKWSLYKIEWRYVISYVRFARSADLQGEPEFKPSFPRDLRRPADAAQLLSEPPAIVRIPT
jgi:hypothetical protein